MPRDAQSLFDFFARVDAGGIEIAKMIDIGRHAELSVELDAIPPDALRGLVRAAIERHLPAEQFKILKAAEERERAIIAAFVGDAP